VPREPRPIRLQPLWVRVDENRVRLGIFVACYVAGAALLLTSAMVGVPGSLIGALLVENPSAGYWNDFFIVWAAAFGLLLAFGAFYAAIQLSNAEHWVRGHLNVRDLKGGEAQGLVEAVADMALAAGLSSPPRIAVVGGAGDGINAFALGTTRSQPLIGVTPAFLTGLSSDEQRAVVAGLIARIIAGDIMFGTALAALMGPIKAVRESPRIAGGCLGLSGSGSDGSAEPKSSGRGSGCGDGCGSGCGDGCGDLDLDEGVGVVLVVILIAALTYAAVLSAAWIVTLWGRVLQRTAHEKADAEGMLLLKDPAPMLSAFRKTARSSNRVGDSDLSYDGIFYTSVSGSPKIERVEERRYRRLREIVGVDGLAAADLEPGEEPPPPAPPADPAP
jgi:Zn-dependent protease with chaperone function